MTQPLSLRFAAKISPQVYDLRSSKTYTPAECPDGYQLVKDLKTMLSSDAFTKQLMDDRYSDDPEQELFIIFDPKGEPAYRLRQGISYHPLGKTLEEAKTGLWDRKKELLFSLSLSITGAAYAPDREKRIPFLTEFFADEKHADLQAQALAYLNTRPDIPVKLQAWQEAIPHLENILETLKTLRSSDEAVQASGQPNPKTYLAYVRQNGLDPLEEVLDILIERFRKPLV